MDQDERIAALEARIASLETALDEALGAGGPAGSGPAATTLISHPGAAHDTGDGGVHDTDVQPTRSRRALLAGAGAAAAGAAAAMVASAAPAAATDGLAILQGVTNTGTAKTTIRTGGEKALSLRDTSSDLAVSDNAAVLNAHAYASQPIAIWATTQRAFVAGVVGESTTTTSTGGLFMGGASNIVLSPGGSAGPLRPGATEGALVCDASNELWFKVGSSTWRKLSGPSTAGALHLLATPKRVYDSRPNFLPATGPKTPLVNTTRTLDAKNNASGVPTGAIGILVNFAVTNTNSGGYGTLWAAGQPDPGTASINWSKVAGLTLNNTVVTAVDASAQFICKIAGSADVVIDVVGYYR